ncbi:amino acid adenylation domain-containing protein [Laspinema sp. D1]|uniref:Amino acid adenylation domain-containing protein n=1 Tax=Laspinema palackyanum D2a TaxID=2953684 RepID=A0ABT2MST3_9CYAN|nr:amino acid adenylation domain-containing protein [Laspinema sp. D2a]
MTTVNFLASLKDLGIRICREGNQLRYRAPKGVITSNLKEELLERKTQIIEWLKEAQNSVTLVTHKIINVDRNTDLPLSFSQQRLWFLHQLDSQNPFYNESCQFQIIGVLNVAALEQTINEIIRRHEALRTIFTALDELPIQRILPSLTINLSVRDLQDLREAEVQKIITREARQPFDLNKPPLLRFSLLRLGSEYHLLILTLHHIIIDGWSMGILIEELSALYQAFSTGFATPLPELAIQYGDFTVWQRQWLTQELQQRQLDYWKEQLADAPRLLELPTDYPRPSVQTFSGAIKKSQIKFDLTAKLQEISQQSKTTFFVTLLAVFVLLLHRYSGQDDICIGSPFANRNRTEIEPVIGFFVNTLVLRTQIKENPSFSEFITQVQQVVLDAYAHQDVPFDKVVEVLQPERSLSYNPLYQVMFVLENFALDTLDLPGISLTPGLVERGTAQCDLSLSLWETKTGLVASWEYNSDLFKADTIARMAGHYQTLLEAITLNPEQRISELPLLTPADRHQLLVEWNNTRAEYPQDKCIHQLFEEQVERSPDTVAVIFEGEQLTYRELNAKANQLAHYLRSLGVEPEVLVGICVERSFDTIVGILGVLKAGGVYVPIDPAYPPERIAYMLNDSDLPVLLAQQKLVASLPEHQARVVCLDADWEEISVMPFLPPITGVTSENLAYIIYTSGSTGKPKGVLIAHQGLCNLVETQIKLFKVRPDSCVLQFASISFDASIWEIIMALCVGGTLCLGTREQLQPGPKLLQLLKEQKITHANFVPSVLAALPNEELPALENIVVGGEECPPSLVERWASGRRFFNLYGPTESTVCATIAQCFNSTGTLSIGRPIANTQTYILDPHNQPVPIGVPGELHIAGVGLAKGYLNRPDLTDEKFIPNPFSNELGSRLYKTGDLARYLPDGNIEYLGRIDDQVKVRGFRIELGEIEAALSQHPNLLQATVALREDIPGQKNLVAYTVPLQEPAPPISELRDFLKRQLPDYMIPNAFVTLAALLITPNGKVDRRLLPAPDIKSLIQTLEFVAPQTPTEELVASIWEKVLGVEQASVNANFFELGGHSLVATQVISQLNSSLGLHLPLSKLFELPTVASLSNYIDATLWTSENIENINTSDEREEFEL